MTQDEIMEMARKAHRKLVTEVYVGHMGQLNPWEIELLKIFANLVAAKEREACVEVILDSQLGCIGVAVRMAYLIRARGEQA